MAVENQIVGNEAQMPCMSDYYHNRFAGRVTKTGGAYDLKAWSRELGGCPVWRSL